MADQEVLIEVRDLCMYFPIRKGFTGHKVADIRAVDGISFDINKGEILGLMGESGCGKTATALCLLQLNKPIRGRVCYKGVDLVNLTGERMRNLRREMQLISENPSSSLNPRMRIRDIIAEPLQVHKIAVGEECKARVDDLLEMVQIDPEMAEHFPHEFNLEQRLRIEIARSMSLRPNFVICDDPGSDLGLEAQTRIAYLLKWFQNWLKITYLFIARDWKIASLVCDRIMVMYGGKIVEIAPTGELSQNSLHPYTRTWLTKGQLDDNAKENPSVQPTASSGCRFQYRCEEALPVCRVGEPVLRDIGNQHWVACHRLNPDK